MSIREDASEVEIDSSCLDQPWGTIATNVPDAPTCISDCRARFLRLLLPNNETFDKVCQTLSEGGSSQNEQLFWTLYCCDAQLCGVDNLWESSLDPNVNWLINSCQNNGYYSIVDPGPPATAYTCSNSIGELDRNSTCPHQTRLNPTGVPTRTSSPGLTKTHPGSQETTFISTHTSIQDPSLAVSIDISEAEDGYSSAHVPARIKVTIILATLAGLSLIITFIACLLRARRKSTNNKQDYSSSQSKNYSWEAPSRPADHKGITSPDKAADTELKSMAPPRLQHRRYLSPLLNRNDLQPFEHEAGMNRMDLARNVVTTDRRDPFVVTNTSSYLSLFPPPPSSPASPKPCLLRDTDSYTRASQPNTPTSPSWTATAKSFRGSAGTGTWPPRRHRAKGSANSSIPGSPGPPPDRALPSTPPKSPRALLHQSQDSGMTMNSFVSCTPSYDAILSPESHDLCQLTEACAGDSRHSWGSWGVGGGGPGVLASSSKKGADDLNSPLLEEMDLERMGGRY